MKKSLILLIIILQLVFAGAYSLYGQSPVGKWEESGQKATLILKGDFTYSLTYQNGSSTGYWSSGGGQFCLRDASASAPVCYTVISYTASAMVLRDINGVFLNYKKVVKSTPAVPVQKQSRVVKGANRVIAVKGDNKLTHGNLRTGIDLTQFIIGHKVTDNELRALKQKLVEEFNAEPAYVLKEINGIAGSMSRVYSLTDPYRIGLARQLLFAAFYKATRNMREDQKPLMIQVINKYIKVLAYDDRNNLVLTNRDVDGYINYMIFNSELSGQRIDANYSVRTAVTAQLVNNFNSMPLGQKQMLTSASLIWQLMDANWKRLNQTQKNQYVIAYRNQIASQFRQSQQNSGYSQQWTPPKNYGSQKKSLAQMRRDFNAKQNMFTMMQNMNTNSHALSLNIIENIGGTGNYWKVTDY